MTEDWEHKLDARSRSRLRADPTSGPLAVLVELASPLDAISQAQLESAGFTVVTELGAILTGQVAEATDLARAAQLPCVRRIEMAGGLHQE